MIRHPMYNPPPPPGAGQPPLPPYAGGQVVLPSNLANPGLRIVGGLIDLVILAIVVFVIDTVTRGSHGVASIFGLVITVGYLAFMWNTRGQSIGMMVFGFKVRDAFTGQFPRVGPALARAFVWWLEFALTFVCLLGFLGWGWQLWDSRHQAIHDKVAGTIVTTS